MSCNQYRGSLSIQWHITTNCGNRCRHCYMFDERTYHQESQGQLNYTQLLAVLNQICDFEAKWGFSVKNFFITGGDPLLHPQWYPFLREVKSRGKAIHLMGNPETLTPENLRKLQEIGVVQFQMSLDGTEEIHDFYRGQGSFQRTIDALSRLKQYGIKSAIMSTLTPENREHLIDLMEFIAWQTPADGFAFDLVCSVGNATDISPGLTAEITKDCFVQYLAKKEELKSRGAKIRIAEKPKFFSLLHYDNDQFFPFDDGESVAISGCYVGFTCYTILSDGSVMACRRFPLTVGKMPEQAMDEIFFGSCELKKFRRPQFYEECGDCQFFKVCRGCPALSFADSGDPFAKNPLCFRDSLSKQVATSERESISMETTLLQEADLVASYFNNAFVRDYQQYISNPQLVQLIGRLLNNSQAQRSFFSDPQVYCGEEFALNKKELAFICYYIDAVNRSRMANPIKYALATIL